MAELVLTPTGQNVFNELDNHGLLLGLQRLTGESNADYKQRLLDVFVHRSNSTLKGLIYGITRELGLDIFEAIRISSITDGNGDILLPYGAIVFEEQNCTIYSDYSEGTVLETFDRHERADGAYYIQDLATLIQDTGYFNVTVLDSVEDHFRSACIFNQSTAGIIVSEDISTGGSRIKLAKSNLIPNTVAVRSASLSEAVSSQTLLRKAGQYYIDHTNGILYTTSVPTVGSSIRYEYISTDIILKGSQVIFHDLQSSIFRTKMFEQFVDQLGEVSNGISTVLGQDLIDELKNVTPVVFGE